ncbi:MAG TPA: UDP-N-acetylglucosamine 2-epimerase [Oculatellaceae cyanobacterium]|jgi:GDP/UDP-N,N'-diacetylbacillosamine 2-epimerase (hydrolysing)
MTAKRLKVGVFTGTRAEYGLLHPIVKGMQQAEDFEPALYVSGSHLDPRYGGTLSEIHEDGLPIALQLPLEETGSNLAGETGVLCQRLGAFFAEPENRPDCVLLLGDRYETLAVAVAAFLSNIPIAHLHGGDVVRGGMLDDPIRHAITKLAHLHFPATRASAERILKMGEEPWRVVVTGAPALDNIRTVERLERSFFAERYRLDPEKPWILFTQHPITTEPELAGAQARQTLSAIASLGDVVQVMVTYPNHDPGSQDIIAVIEQEFAHLPQFRVEKSLGRVKYLNFLRHATVVVGNSSSGLLETAHFQVPCLNVGERQKGRERGGNVVDVTQNPEAIAQALRKILFDADFRMRLQQAEHPFGDGNCTERVLEVLRKTTFDHRLLRKQLTY